ncbi:hypothetical protein ABZ504_52185, partial [Streptomyces mirabilis]|uniref:hypothetical protein n=1 Tax=Streptomyces mirabilis TaxID=68239 RepID=UPI0033C36265
RPAGPQVPETGREPAAAAPAVNSGSRPFRWRWTRCAGPADRRGLAAELAREHGGVDCSWQRAVNEACVVYELEQSAEPGTSP